jgi:hypothetical protein
MKWIIQKSLHNRTACHLSFNLKKNRCSSPNPAEAVGEKSARRVLINIQLFILFNFIKKLNTN